MQSEPIVFPCRFEEHSHQHFDRGWCYGIGISEAGHPYALLAYDGDTRNVLVRRLDGAYNVTLLPGGQQ